MRFFPVLLATLVSLVFAASASAATTWTVNDPGDAGDGTCDVSCTLRDAVTNAADGTDSADGNHDTIRFGSGTTTVTLASPLPIDKAFLKIDGCASTETAPCVTIEPTSAADNALDVQAGGVHVDRVSIVGAHTAIAANSSAGDLEVTGSWLGVTAANTPGGNAIAVAVNGPSSVIGGTAAADRNRIENSSTAGVTISSDTNTVAGNDFKANAEGVAFRGGGASGNQIGGTTSAPTTCDGACNAFAGGTGNAIQVDHDAIGTMIKGNYVGLDADGTSDPNTAMGISIDGATSTTVGGFLLGDPNVVQGGTYGIHAEGQDTTIWGNRVGLNPAGTAKVAAPSEWGIHADEPVNHEARLFSNRVAVGALSDPAEGGIDVSGEDVVLHGNVVGVGTGGQNVGGSGFGIHVTGVGGEIGGPSSDNGNTVAHAAAGGIDIAGGKNNVLENNTLTQNGRGVVVRQLNTNSNSEASGNEIGGDTTATANRISGSAHDAITIMPRSASSLDATNPDSGNVIGVNTGSGNGAIATDLFVDLGPDGPGNAGAVNGGIAPPSITVASGSVVRGTGARAGATVRVFTRPAGQVGTLGAYVGTSTAASNGTWSVAAGSALANGTRVVALQTDATVGSSELSGEHAVDTVGPAVTIPTGPTGPTRDTTPTFTFASEAGATFQCQVDSGAYAACTSPRTTAPLGDGAHTFRVRGRDAIGNVGPAVVRTFTVDTTAPTTAISTKPKALTRSRSPKFSFKANEPAVIECSIDGKKYEVCSVIGPLKDGRHTLRARAYDEAGNTDATPATWTFRVDATAPKVKLGATAKRKGKTLRIKVACPKAEKDGPCRGTLTVKRKGKVIAKKAYKIKAGKTATVVLKPKHLPAKGAKLALSTTAKDKLGNKKPVRKTAKVK